jgi:mono/diheme cytochrome c family protein
MRTSAWISLAVVHALTGCSSESSDGDPFAQGGSSGAGVTGGKAGVTGGAPTATGGSATTGGSTAVTGGTGTTGGATTVTGGAPSKGGAGSGGTATTGGLGAGGASGGSGGAGKGGGVNGGTAGMPSGGSGGGASGGGGAMTPEAFYAANCASCHGARGEGKAMLGPEIQHPVRDYATWVVRNGRMGHPDFKSSVMAPFTEAALPKATLDGIFDWLSVPALPKPTTGEALFKDYCATCHAADGSGGAAAHGITDVPKSEISELVRAGHGGTQYSKRTGYMPKWSTTELTDAELDLIYSHLQTL